MTRYEVCNQSHHEERSDEAIQVQRLPAAAMAEVWGKMDRHGLTPSQWPIKDR